MYSSSGSSTSVTSQLKLTFLGTPLLVLLLSEGLPPHRELTSLKFVGLMGLRATGGTICVGGTSSRRSGADMLRLANAPFLFAAVLP